MENNPISENLCSSPESGSQGGLYRGDTVHVGFWVEDGKLAVIHGAVHPDFCLRTGAVEEWLTRQGRRFSWRPPWIRWMFCFLVIGSLILFLALVSLAPLLCFVASIFTVKRMNANFCFSRGAVKIRKAVSRIKFSYLGILIAIWLVLREWFEIGLFLWPMVVLLGLLGLNLLYPFPALSSIRRGVVTLKNIFPEVLRQLRRWQNTHFPKSYG